MIERFDPDAASDNPVYARFAAEHLLRYSRVADALRRDPPGGLVVDAACGAGYGHRYLCWQGEYLGIDNSAAAVARCRDLYPDGEFRVADLCDPDLFRGLDPAVVVSLETAEHLPDPGRFLASVREALPGGGRLFFSAPTSLTRDFDPYHLRDWDADRWRSLLESSGFRVLSAEPMEFEGKFTDFCRMVPLSTRQRLRVLGFALAHREYRRDRWRNWVLRNRFYWCSHLFACVKGA